MAPHKLIFRILSVVRSIEARTGLDQLDLSARAILRFVAEQNSEGNPTRSSEIIQLGFLGTAPTVYSRLSQLEEAGWIKSAHDPEDGRVKRLTLHHILEEDVADAPEISALWTTFWEGCGEADILAAHNAGFEQHFHPGGGRRWIDTYKCALTVWPDAPAHNNQALRYWLDLDRSAGFDRAFAMPPHRALPDAYVTAHILARLLQACSVEDMISISSKPALLSTVGFGKHKGMKFADVPADYLEWIRDKSDLKEDVKFSAAHWLSVRSRSKRA